MGDLEKKSQRPGEAGGRNGGARGGAGRVGGSQNEYDQRMENLLTELLPDRATEVIGALTKGKANASVEAPEKREREEEGRRRRRKRKRKRKGGRSGADAGVWLIPA